MKKKGFAFIIILLCLSVAVGATLAYFTTSATARNVITTGGISILLSVEGDDAQVNLPAGGITGLMPGQTISKIISVTNIGPSEAWIRVKLGVKITGADRTDLPVYAGGEPVLTYQILDGWLDGGDGYYYCKKSIAQNEPTGALLESIRVSEKVDNRYQGSTVDLTIVAEAVQIAHNGETVTEAIWPEN